MKVVIIDYGMGNVGSILNMLKKIGYDAIISHSKNDIVNADKLILPGVGAFDEAMKRINELGISDTIRHQVLNRKKHILGICLGMQILGESSEEGELPGLNLLPFRCLKFKPEKLNQNYFKVPHIGWEYVKNQMHNNLVRTSNTNNPRYYFVHSYYVPFDVEITSQSCNYIVKFSASVQKENIYGTQYHPEKSHFFGMELLRNYMKLEI